MVSPASRADRPLVRYRVLLRIRPAANFPTILQRDYIKLGIAGSDRVPQELDDNWEGGICKRLKTEPEGFRIGCSAAWDVVVCV